jgi:hypothetical protein
MASEPDVRIWIDFGHVAVDFLGGVVVTIFASEGMGHARSVAFEGRRLALAYLFPVVLTALATATAEEEIVIDLVVCCGIGAVKDRRRRAFDADNDGHVVLVRKDVATKTVVVPAKIIGIVEAVSNRCPLRVVIVEYVCI